MEHVFSIQKFRFHIYIPGKQIYGTLFNKNTDNLKRLEIS